jgi:magnesium-transporting ATPase (P-type)
LLDGSAQVRSFVPFSARTRCTEALIDRNGRSARVSKGALRTLATAAALDSAAIAELEAKADEAAKRGFRVLAVASADAQQPLRIVGLALLRDAPRPDSRELIEELRALGVAVKMLTGDALAIAREVARELGLGEVIHASRLRPAGGASKAEVAGLVEDSGGFAEVFPEDKYNVVRSLQAAGHIVGMTGDGVNDAPALRQAEVGIAMSNATDVAKGAASVVLTTEGLKEIAELVKGGRAIYQRVLTWIVNKVSRTILKAGFVVIAFLVTGKFVISALGMILVVFMTDFVKIALSTDRVRPSQKPETWNIGPLVVLAVILGASMLIEALVLLAFAWHRFGLANDGGRLQTFTFQTLLFFALFSLVSIRERRAFWNSRPSAVLACALLADAALGVLIGMHGLADLSPLPLRETAVILTVAAICSLGLNDLVKTSWGRFAARGQAV